MDGFIVLFDWLLSQVTHGGINAVKAIATLLWWLEKIVANVSHWFTSTDTWFTIMNSITTALSTIMPDILRNLTGIALPLMFTIAGLFMVVMAQDKSPVKLHHGIAWFVLVGALFINPIAGENGYTLITKVEQLRHFANTTIVALVAPQGDDRDLLAVPMRATIAEIEDSGWRLPATFEAQYFPPPSAFATRRADFSLFGSMNIEIESAGAQGARQSSATQGLLMATVSLIPTGLIAMFGIVYAILSAGTILLITMFFASLPLGFLEIGKEILFNLGRQYLGIVSMTFTNSLFIGLVIQTSLLTVTNPTLEGMITYIPIALLFGIVLQFMINASWFYLTNTIKTVTATIETVTARNLGTTPEAIKKNALTTQAGQSADSLAKLAMIGTIALATGGTGIAMGAIASQGKLGAVGVLANTFAPKNDIATGYNAVMRSRHGVVGAAANLAQSAQKKTEQKKTVTVEENVQVTQTDNPLVHLLTQPESAPESADLPALYQIKELTKKWEANEIAQYVATIQTATESSKKTGENAIEIAYRTINPKLSKTMRKTLATAGVCLSASLDLTESIADEKPASEKLSRPTPPPLDPNPVEYDDPFEDFNLEPEPFHHQDYQGEEP